MSTFKGFLNDKMLDFIAIDFFGPSTYDCTYFLLSHHHSDHTTGLFNQQFVECLNSSNDKCFICSPVTAHLLQRDGRFQIAAEKICIVDVNSSLRIARDNLKTDLNVILIPAGHCPGSVMFLFEFDDKRILYTGDYRMSLSSLKRMKPFLANKDGSARSITDLHIDTTFAMEDFSIPFPDREQSEKFISRKVEEWLTEANCAGEKITIILRLSAKYSVEYLYQCLYRKFRQPVAVHDYDSYVNVKEMSECVVSMDSNRTWNIHACGKGPRYCSAYYRTELKKALKPCVQSFLYDSNKTNIITDKETGVPYIQRDYELKVFYATHASPSELRDFVEYFKPYHIFANVIVNTTEKEIIDRLRNCNKSKEFVPLPNITPLSSLSLNIEHARKRSIENILDENKRLNKKLNLRF